MLFRSVVFFLFFINVFPGARAQLVVNNAPPYNNVSYLVQNVLLGTGVQVSNITYTGAPVAVGFFNGQNTNLNLDSGIIITSGDIINAVGPNNQGAATTANGTPGDTQLEQITNNTANGSFDAAGIEFDFVANADTIKFEYVFGSEEYPEYVNSSFNDAFAFIISGVSVPLSPTNIALIPSPPAPPNTPVTINNVNNGTNDCPFGGPMGPCTNCAFYVDNCNGVTLQYDGFTVVLQAIFPVQCGQTYHLKMVIADIGDQILDSGVFLKAGSFSSAGTISVSSTVSYGTLNDSTLYEGCGQACITIDRGSNNISNPDTVMLQFSGTAINGIDITLLPDTVFFLPGQDSVTICISGIADALTEGPETLTLLAILLGNSPCSSGDSASLTLYIDDHTPLSVSAFTDTIICPGVSVNLFASTTGGVPPVLYLWSPAGSLNNSTIANPVATPSVTTTYMVSVTDSCNAPLISDSITITVLPPGPVIASGSSITTCLDGNPVMLSVSAIGGAVPYIYQWTTIAGNDSVNSPGSSSTSLLPTGSGTFVVSVSDFCGNTDTQVVQVLIEDCITIIPNVISANADGVNDFFVITNLEKYPGSRLVIFNRWGNKLYDNPDYQNNWDANNYSDGTYYYVLFRSDGETFPGWVAVVR